jgi:DNA-binding winged helix-turn-helix (wHTH) protein
MVVKNHNISANRSDLSVAQLPLLGLILLAIAVTTRECLCRQQLQRRLWPSNTFVECDKGIYNAIKRLRETLSDDAETPRYIETIPRHGTASSRSYIRPARGCSRILASTRFPWTWDGY